MMARNRKRACGRWHRVAALLAAGVLGLAGPAPARQAPDGPQVLGRGPIHEAFAQPVVYNPTPALLAPKPPPQTAIEEIPPAQKPQGADVEWIPGYWSWDDERDDYIWISGIWRDIPPGRQWIPGYWSRAENGFLWTSGFWAPAASNAPLNYLPAPPPTLENGPNTPQPGPEFAWLPGSWTWVQERYAWRPGYWVRANPDWIWVPSSYVPTPSGYVYNDGYWDYTLARRGVPFAPVAFAAFAPGQATYTYTPNYVLPATGLLASLFVRPSYGHYYYGDYYQSASIGPRAGYIPWFGLQQSRVGYDPIYASMSALNAGRPDWDRRIRDDYQYRVENREARPAATFERQRAQLEERRGRGEDVRNLTVAYPLDRWAGHPEAAHRFDAVAEPDRAQFARRQAEFQEVRQERARMEQQARIPEHVRPEEHRPQRLELPRPTAPAAPGFRPQGPAHAAPPPHPEAHPSFHPTFEREPALIRPNFAAPHREPAPAPARPESRPAAPARPPHEEPRPRGEAEHHRPGKPR